MAERKSFGQLRNVLEMPDLISLQVDSYDNFLQRFVPPAERKRQGLQEIFMDIFPLKVTTRTFLWNLSPMKSANATPRKAM